MELPAHYMFSMHININKKLHRTSFFYTLTAFVKYSHGEDSEIKLLTTKSKDTVSGSLKCQAQCIIRPRKWFPLILVSSPNSGSQVEVGSAVRSPHTVSPPCFQLLHHIKRQLKIHTFLILLFQVSNCCTLHKDVI